jgi:6-phosphofructokinase 1
VGYALAAQLEERLGETEVRVTVLGHLQRGGIPTAFDRVLATQLGHAAVDLAMRGESGVMVAVRGNDIVPVPIAEAVDRLKLVEPDDPVIMAARGVRTSFGDEPLSPMSAAVSPALASDRA